MKRYISTLLASMDRSISVRISISYYSRTRKKSQKYYDSATIRVGSSVVQISRLPAVELLPTLRVTLTALVLLPYYIDHAARLSPRQRASLGFFEKGEIFEEDDNPYHAIEQKIDSVINGRIYNFNGITVKSTPPMSYIRTLLPRFSSARYDDAIAIARVIRAVAGAPKRMARFGIIGYDSDSVLSITRAYYWYIKLKSKQNFFPNEDEIILHAARCSTRCCFSSVDFDTKSYVNKLYRLFLYVSKFLRNWHLPPIGGNLDFYSPIVLYLIIKTGIEYERKKDYQNLRRFIYGPSPIPRYIRWYVRFAAGRV